MKLREMAHIHVEKLLGSTLLPMTYPVDGTNPLQGNNVPTNALGDNRCAVYPRVQ